MRHAPRFELIRSQILEPLRIESSSVRVKGRRTRKDLCITSPSKPLIALRAISRNVEEIPFLSLEDVVLKLIYEALGRLKLTRRTQFGMDHYAGQTFRSESTRIAIDCDKSKSLK